MGRSRRGAGQRADNRAVKAYRCQLGHKGALRSVWFQQIAEGAARMPHGPALCVRRLATGCCPAISHCPRQNRLRRVGLVALREIVIRLSAGDCRETRKSPILITEMVGGPGFEPGPHGPEPCWLHVLECPADSAGGLLNSTAGAFVCSRDLLDPPCAGKL